MIKVLILGTSGMLGKAIYNTLKQNKKIKVYHTGKIKRKVELTSKINFLKFIKKNNPNLIINCIGFTNIDKCEKNKIYSKRINFKILRDLFSLKKNNKLNFDLIQISTDQFYYQKNLEKSNENSKLFLINTYCKHKRMAEKVSLKNKALVLRTNFFGKSKSKNKSFSDWVVKSFKSNNKFNLFDDIFFNPLSMKTISKIILQIIVKKQFVFSGIYNLGTKNGIYKNIFAKSIARKLKIYHSNYSDINVSKVLKVKRSKNMCMDVKKFEEKFNIKLPSIEKEINSEVKNYL
jgi:dTDP-4-dehydrorhamnose reductase